METRDLKNDPAFPMDFEQRNDYQFGMSKRFYAACAAMNGLLASTYKHGAREEDRTDLVKFSYAISDELLKQENE